MRVPGSLVRAGDESVYVVRAGPEGAPVVLLLHGWGASTFNYRFVVPALVRSGLRVLAPDLRGHGRSDKPADPAAYSSGAMAAHVAGLLDALGERPAVAVGQSLGGAIVLDLAAWRPDLVPGAVLVAPIGFTQLARVDLLRRIGVGRLRHLRVRRWIIQLVLRRIYGERRQWTGEDVDGYLEPLQDPRAIGALLALVESFDFAPREPRSVAHLGARLHLLFGALDRPIPYHEAVSHARRFAGARVDVLAGVGHVPAEEVPDVVVAAIVAMALPGNNAAPPAAGAGRRQ